MPQLLPPELPRHGPPALVAVLLMDELGCTQQLLYRLMAWVGLLRWLRWGQEEMLPLSVSVPCQGAE